MAYEVVHRQLLKSVTYEATDTKPQADVNVELVVQYDKDFYKLVNTEAGIAAGRVSAEVVATVKSSTNQLRAVSGTYCQVSDNLLRIRYLLMDVESTGYPNYYGSIDTTKNKSQIGEWKSFPILYTDAGSYLGVTDTYIYDKTSLTVPVVFDFETGLINLEFSGAYEIYVEAADDDSLKTHVVTGTINPVTVQLHQDKSAKFLTADNFTDEQNPAFTFEPWYVRSYEEISEGFDMIRRYRSPYNSYKGEELTSLQAAISFDGVTADIPYRDIPLGSTSYTFNLTEAERELLRQKAQGSATVPIYYLTRTGITLHYNKDNTDTDKNPAVTAYFDSKIQRNLTIVNGNPIVNPDVIDIREETLDLTGDENTIVRYESAAEYAINAEALKYAEIVSQSVQCGSKVVSNLPYGVINNAESGTFIFKATDSRNLSVETVLQKNFIEYVKPTCYQKLTMEMSSEFGSRVVVKVNGNYYNGSFGAVDNTLLLEIRHTNGDGNWGEWQTITETPTFNGNTYSVETKIEDFVYSKAYIFQCRATDKLNSVESAEYTLRIYPVFDWGENDFNFNVPIKMDGETVLRHGLDTNETVLSASGGGIYIRPGGTDDTSGEIVISPEGVVSFSEEVNFEGTVKIGGVDINDLLNPEEEPDEEPEDTPVAADYVIETGTESMGSSGTWYWTKWASGRAECYGTRDFGLMTMNTSVTNGYKSPEMSQSFPTDLFIEAPDYLNMTAYPNANSNYDRVFVSPAGTGLPTASNTGGFHIIRLTSGNAAATHVSFEAKGRWK